MGTSKYEKNKEQSKNKNNELIPYIHGKPINKEEIDELYRYGPAICKIKVENLDSGTGLFLSKRLYLLAIIY